MNAENSALQRDFALFGHVKVKLAAEVGSAEMTIEEVLGLKVQDVVALNESSEAIITLLLNGKPLARGELLAIEDKLGVRITEML